MPRSVASTLPLDVFEGTPIIACVRCRTWITVPAAAIDVAGAHRHERENPAGIRFRFACFANARALRAHGNASREFTWFPGYVWQVQICDGCQEHLGWMFATADHRFHGLILDRLVEIDAPPA